LVVAPRLRVAPEGFQITRLGRLASSTVAGHWISARLIAAWRIGGTIRAPSDLEQT
jgi:hypothetical protein